jgi:hypothetical protein
MRSSWFLFDREPVAVSAFIRLALLAGVSFGLKLSNEQMLALMAAVEAGLGLATRQNVTSQQTLHDAGLTQRGVTKMAKDSRAAEDLVKPEKEYDS